ncbi:MAG: hypothetical protein DHS20C14_10190 [Phycisphaeraceae bacterium]|nr:MAG: hypothetical protein DHS20C14_10190 [Phycisphaeraceae bacterium]
MGGPGGTILQVLLIAVLGTIGVAAAIFLFVKLFGLVWKILGNVFRFIGAEVSDAVRLIGVVIAAPVFALLVVLNVVIGRWSASGHYGRAFGGEMHAGGSCIYRLLIANPLRLVGLGGVLEGVEQRVPQAVAEAPGRDKPSKARVGMFDGYTIIGSLKGGGSGGKLYIAEPDDMKRAALARRGVNDLDRVVIKVFSQKDGSTLDQILRESRALEAARRLGLVLEHNSDTERFFYVMRYVPGESLGALTHRMHASSAAGGLDARRLDESLGYIADLLASLHVYHQGGLWHKDVKPDNIIVDNPGTPEARAHLVDLGLVTPMRSAMTLTTHGTEYFRDPELVRQALRGVKVHQIDGAKFDVYSAGAVLFSIIENSFPAHGGLSQVTKSCPDALRWVIRRAMAEYDSRYPTAAAMLGDLETIRAAKDPFALKPAELPSMAGGPVPEPAPVEAPFVMPAPVPASPPEPPRVARAGSPVPPPPPVPAALRAAPKLTIASWWTGRYKADGTPAAPGVAPSPAPAVRHVRAAGERLPANEQVKQARERARIRRERANTRISHRRGVTRNPRGTRAGMTGAIVAFLIMFLAVAGIVMVAKQRDAGTSYRVDHDSDFDSGTWDMGDGWHDDLPRLERTVLIVSDLSHPMDPALDLEIDQGVEALSELGVEFLGDLVSDGADERAIGLVARARADRGATPLETDELRTRLRKLLKSEPGISAVVWVAPMPSTQDGMQIALVGREVYSYRTADVDHADDYLIEAVLDLATSN